MLTWQPNTLEPALIPGVTLDQGSSYERKVSDSERNTDTLTAVTIVCISNGI